MDKRHNTNEFWNVTVQPCQNLTSVKQIQLSRFEDLIAFIHWLMSLTASYLADRRGF